MGLASTIADLSNQVQVAFAWSWTQYKLQIAVVVSQVVNCLYNLNLNLVMTGN